MFVFYINIGKSGINFRNTQQPHGISDHIQCYVNDRKERIQVLLKSRYAYGSSCLPLYNTPLITTFYRMSPLKLAIQFTNVLKTQGRTGILLILQCYYIAQYHSTNFLLMEELGRS